MTTSIVPNSRPQMTSADVRAALAAGGLNTSEPALLGVRGYYRDTMGAEGKNDIGIYDDAIFYLSPSAFASFNANVDPSRIHPGVAQLVPGAYRYKIGIHGLSKPADRQYKALVQGAPVTVRRAGAGLDKGWFGINIHRGSYTGTSSEGCQTIHPDQWLAFIGLVDGDMHRHKIGSLYYLLSEREPE